MARTVLLLCATVIAAASAAPFLVVPASGSASLQKSVFVSVGADASSSGSGGEVVASKPVVVPVVKPVAYPVPYPVPVPVEVPVETERPVAVAVHKPVYVQQTGGGGSGGAFTGSFHVNAGNVFDNIFNIPISVLRSVNQFLNNNFRGGATVHVNAVKGLHYGGGGSAFGSGNAGSAGGSTSGGSSGASSSSSSSSSSISNSGGDGYGYGGGSSGSDSNSGSNSGGGSTSSSSSSSSSSASSSGIGSGGVTVHKTRSPTFYNDIFNIPVSALTSVNALLTGGK